MSTSELTPIDKQKFSARSLTDEELELINRDWPEYLRSLLALERGEVIPKEYWGGFFDEAIEVLIQPNHGKKGTMNYRPRLTIERIHEGFVLLVNKLLPGKGNIYHRQAEGRQKKTRWVVTKHDEIEEVVNILQPLLCLKKEQANILMDFLDIKEELQRQPESNVDRQAFEKPFWQALKAAKAQQVEIVAPFSPKRLAGMFDGGFGRVFISTKPQKNKAYPASHYLSVAFYSPNSTLLQTLVSQYSPGKNIISYKQRVNRPGEYSYLVIFTDEEAKNILTVLRPFVQLKLPIVQLGLDFYNVQKRIGRGQFTLDNVLAQHRVGIRKKFVETLRQLREYVGEEEQV